MSKQTHCRPSLRITRHLDQTHAASFAFDVWNPFAVAYQPVVSVAEGMARVDRLAKLIARMWREDHPKQNVLADVPASLETRGRDLGDQVHWAELRANGTTFRSYDTRYLEQPSWARAAGLIQACEKICARVGFAAPKSGI